MAEARQRDAWQHTAELLALTYNCHRGPGTRPVTTDACMPKRFRDRVTDAGTPLNRNNIHLLRAAFVRPSRRPSQ